MKSNDFNPAAAQDNQATPLGCDLCRLGVEITATGHIRACSACAGRQQGHRDRTLAASFVLDCLTALSVVRELLWPVGDPDAAWSPDTIDDIARRLELLRPAGTDLMPEAIRYCGAVTIALSYDDSDGCYHGKVQVDGHTYSVCVGPPTCGYGPGVAYDSPEAYDRVAHAALSFAAADTEWGAGDDVFTPASETDARGWVIRRRPTSSAGRGG